MPRGSEDPDMDGDVPPTADPDSIAESGVACAFAAYSCPSLGDSDPDDAVDVRTLVDESDCLVDAYLTRGLSPPYDFLLRVHAAELAAVQGFLRGICRTTLGRRATLEESFLGVTASEEYVPELPDLAAELDARSYEGAPPRYAIVIPTRKSAEWWTLPEAERVESMREHVEPTLEYLETVKRQLYRSTGLDDVDFLTYFETDDPIAFQDLVSELQTIEEFRYTEYGNPTIVGTIRSIEELLATSPE